MFLLLKMLLLFATPPKGFLTWVFGNWPLWNGFCSPGNWKGFMLLDKSEKLPPNLAGPFWAWAPNPKAWPEFKKPGVCFGRLSCCCCCDSLCCCGCCNSISSNSWRSASSWMKYLVIISSGKLKHAFNLLIQVDGSGANKNCLEDLEMNKNITDKLKSNFNNLRIHSLEEHRVS